MTNPWFRLYHEFAVDPKVQMLSEVNQRRFIMLLCMKCSNSDEKLSNSEIAFYLRIKLGEWIDTKNRLMSVDLIDDDAHPIKNIEVGSDRPPAHIWRVLREEVFLRDDYTCLYCGARGVKLECDHIDPVSKGGSNETENLATACASCNRSKSNKTIEEWMGL